MKRLRILVLMHEDFVPPDSIEGLTDKEMAPWKTEYDVVSALEDCGHHTRPLGVANDLRPLAAAIEEWNPHVVFNLLEEFGGHGVYVPYLLGYLELIRQPYTGCNPEGLLLTRHKALAKKLLRYHRVRVPDFVVFPRGKTATRLPRLSFPVIVKSTTEHGSVGIAQASFVRDEEKLKERVAFVHEQLQTDAIVEQYIDGRELYVGVLGNHRLQTLPVWEMVFKELNDNAPRIATERVKWDLAYQKKVGIVTRAAKDLPEELAERIVKTCKRTYRILEQSGYARIDLRLTPEGDFYILESNPNPQLAYGEDFAESAHSIGLHYEKLIQRIVNLGLRAHGDPRGRREPSSYVA